MLTQKLLNLTIAGGSEWVMVLLLVLSVLSVATMIERAVFFRRRSWRFPIMPLRGPTQLPAGPRTWFEAISNSAVSDMSRPRSMKVIP